MKNTPAFVFLMASLLLYGGNQKDPFEHLRYLEGTWVMDNPKVTNTQTFTFIFKGKFLKMETHSVFKPTAEKPLGETHEDIGFFSYDKPGKKVVLRCFHNEGFVNRYTLEEINENGYTLVFISEMVENAPSGTRAKLVFKRTDENEMIQQFYVAWPETEYRCFFDNRLLKMDSSR